MKTALGIIIGLVGMLVIGIFMEEAQAYQTHCYTAMGTRYCESY